MKKKALLYGILFSTLLYNIPSLKAQNVIYPVNTNFQIIGALPAYLNNYYTAAFPVTQISLTLTDADLPNRDVYLRFSMESEQLRISTPVGYKPSTVNLSSGIQYTLTANDLSSYFDQNNLIFEGSFASIARETGRLPEGFYTFKIEVYDYESGALLSNPTTTIGSNAAQARLKYNDPPRVIMPRCKEVLSPSDPQRILFSWQNLGGVQAASQTEYHLHLYELTDPKADPQYAIYNNKVQKVFESDGILGTTFLYDIQYPQLETGKIYIFQIQAIDLANAVVYKNEGKSEVCWFRFGYPSGGNIALVSPSHESSFDRKGLKEFIWEAPDNRIEDQPFIYELRIVEINENQEAFEAIEENPTWVRKLLPETKHTGQSKHTQRNPRVADAKHYAWQVSCNSGTQLVAKSEVQTFYGPQTLKSFIAGKEKVEVISIKNNDVLDLSGKAKVNLGPYGKIKGDFSGIQVEDTYGTDNWVLKSGFISFPLDGEIEDIELKPMNPRNEKAFFRPDSIRIDKDGLWLGGYFEWKFPHPVVDDKEPLIKSKYEFVPFNQFRLNGAIHLPEGGYKFGLAEPMDYEMRLDKESHIFFTENHYTLKMYGDVKLPKRMTEAFSEEDMVIPFYSMEQLYYMELENNRMPYNFRLASNGKIFLKPTHLELDLDPTQSPEPFLNTGEWKGAYFRGFELEFLPIVDSDRQLMFEETLTKKFNRETDPAYHHVKSWFDSQGLQFEIEGVFTENDTGLINTFPSQMTLFQTKIENSIFKEGSIQGKFKIPVISATQDFTYILPINNGEITEVFMEKDGLIGTTYEYNTDSKEQEVHLTINSVEFQEHNHLNFNVDMDWPGLKCHLTALRNFKAWGNHSCGFDIPNGTKVIDQHATALAGENEFTVVIDGVSTGSDYKVYSFAVTGKIKLGDDVVGVEGPPVVNFYSVIPNPYGIRIYGKSNDDEDPQAAFDNEVAKLDKQKEELNQKMEQSLSKTLAELEKIQQMDEQKPVAFQDILKEKEKAVAKEQESELEELNAEGQTEQDAEKKMSTVEEMIASNLTFATNTMLAKVTGKITDVGEEAVEKVKQFVKVPADKAEALMLDKINQIFDGIEKGLVSNAKISEEIDLTSFLTSLVNTARTSTVNEVKRSWKSAIDTRVSQPLVSIVEVDIQGAIVTTLQDATKDAAMELIKTKDPKAVFEEIAKTVADDMTAMAETVVDKLINVETLESMTLGMVGEFVRGISVEQISNDVLVKLKKEASKLAAELALKVAREKLQKALEEKLQGLPINYAGAADALKNGKPQDLLKADKIPIKIPDNPIVRIVGELSRVPNDPIYGDVWVTKGLEIEIKVPKNVLVKARIIQGKKDGNNYWLVEAGNVANDPDKPFGNTAVCVPTELNTPLNLGLFKITHMAGRVSKHMSDNGSGQMVPDIENKSNAMFNFIIEDTKNGDVFNADVMGEIDASQNGTTITLRGDISVKNDMLQAKVLIYHNTAEDHFMCQADIKVEKTGSFCAEGRFLLDVKPGAWRIAMGTFESPIQIVPGCAGWTGLGYVDMNQESAEIGAGAGMSAVAKSPKFPLIIYMVQVGVDAGFDIMMYTNINYRPIRINEAGLVVRAWVYIWEEHKRFVGCGIKKCKTSRNNLVEINMRGDVIMRFHPKPTNLSGKFAGSVKLLGIGIKFKTGFSKNIG